MLVFSKQPDLPIQNEQEIEITHSIELAIKVVADFNFGDSPTPVVKSGHWGRVNVGALKPNQRYRLKLKVINKSDRLLAANKIASGCGCVDFPGAIDFRIDSDESAVIVLSLITPKATDNGKFAVRLDLRDQKELVGTILIGAELSHNLHIGDAMTLEFSERPKSYFVPVIITAPLRIQDLVLEPSEELQGHISVSVLVRDKLNWLKIEVSPDSFEGAYLSGTIRIKAPRYDLEAESRLTLVRTSPIKVSPDFLRLRKIRSDSAEFAQGSLLVRLEKNSSIPAKRPKRVGGRPSATITTNSGAKFKIEIDQLSSFALRLNVRIAEKDFAKLQTEDEGLLQVEFNGEIYQKAVSFFLEDFHD
jgi:hypothetical protein